ncbi:MAG: cytochrome c-type biogenesis protein CcmH [Anaerolineales bacterium]|nr:cytochrome c-type biogenesis protein CcmH [Anaerolineales bacterium]
MQVQKIKYGSAFQKIVLFIILSLLLLAATPNVWAQEDPTQDQINQVAKKLFCPVCENTPLDVCPTEACQQWRDVIRTKLIEGQTEAEILEYFAVMYGDSVLAEPPPRQLAAWLFPVLIILIAVGLLFYWVHSWTRASPRALTTENMIVDDVDLSDPYVKQLEKELAQWK